MDLSALIGLTLPRYFESACGSDSTDTDRDTDRQAGILTTLGFARALAAATALTRTETQAGRQAYLQLRALRELLRQRQHQPYTVCEHACACLVSVYNRCLVSVYNRCRHTVGLRCCLFKADLKTIYTLTQASNASLYKLPSCSSNCNKLTSLTYAPIAQTYTHTLSPTDAHTPSLLLTHTHTHTHTHLEGSHL